MFSVKIVQILPYERYSLGKVKGNIFKLTCVEMNLKSYNYVAIINKIKSVNAENNNSLGSRALHSGVLYKPVRACELH